jgi:chemotaxis protein CheC
VISSYTDRNELYIDALREIGNIGAGNAATSLGVLINENVRISVPEVGVEDFDDVIRALGGAEEICVAVLIDFSGDASGVVLFILSVDDAKKITDIISSGGGDGTDFLSEVNLSGIKEIGNILGAAYLGSIAALAGMTVNLSVPRAAVDMAGAILETMVAEYGAAEGKVMFIDESLSANEQRFRSRVIMFTDMTTISNIVRKLELLI